MGNAWHFPSVSHSTGKRNKTYWYSYFFIVWVFFSYWILILWYTSSHGDACVFSSISHNMGKDSKTHRIGKAWEIGSQEYSTKPIAWGEPGKLLLILFP